MEKINTYELIGQNVVEYNWENLSISYSFDEINRNDEIKITDSACCSLVFKRLYSPKSIMVDLNIYQKNKTITNFLTLDGKQLDLLINKLKKIRKLIE